MVLVCVKATVPTVWPYTVLWFPIAAAGQSAIGFLLSRADTRANTCRCSLEAVIFNRLRLLKRYVDIYLVNNQLGE